jgi:hypothetical protein
VDPHHFVRVVDMQVRMLPDSLPSSEMLLEDASEKRAKDDLSSFEPFTLPLPLPPNCRLYKQSLHYAIPGMQSETDLINPLNGAANIKRILRKTIKKHTVEEDHSKPPPISASNLVKRMDRPLPRKILPDPKGIPVKVAIIDRRTPLPDPLPAPYQGMFLFIYHLYT